MTMRLSQYFHPLVADWFQQKFGNPTEPQLQGWPSIKKNNVTLIAAPTGSGKTLAAFLCCINDLIVKATTNELEERTEVLYISPLKALGNDIKKNLGTPLEEITPVSYTHRTMPPIP